MNPKITLAAVCLLFATCGGAPPPVPPADVTRLGEARRLISAGDPDAALVITDELTHAHHEWSEAWAVAGDGNMALAQVQRQGLNPELVRRDAATAYAHATALDDGNATAWFGLAQAHYALGEFDEARTAASRAVELRSAARKPPADIGAALLIAANCDLQQLIALRQAEVKDGKPDHRGIVLPEKGTLELAQHALARFEALQKVLPGEGYRGSSDVYRWLNEDDSALLELERGVHAAPDAAEIHIAWQELHMQMGQQRALAGAYTRLLRENPGVSVLLWFQGRAQVVIADDLRGKSSFKPAIEAYRKAAESFTAYAQQVPAHKASSDQWVAICELSIARTTCDLGDTDAARQHLYAAAAASPTATEYDGEEPRLRDSFGSHFAGVVFALGRAMSTGGEGALERTLAFYEEIIARYPHKWGFVYNNAALPARDLGVQLTRDLAGKSDEERRTRMSRAMELWEKSYSWYEEAALLSPKDPRIQNDCGLMLIYHLNRDFDHARALFERAIAVGQPQLDALPADAPKDERNFLEEAVGDAWQNIAVLMVRHLNKPFAEVKPFLDKAVTYYPYKQREAARMLQNEGKEPPGNGRNPRSLRGGTAAAGAQGTLQADLDRVRQSVEAAAAAGDLDAAMTALDQAPKALRDYAPYQALRGDWSLRYALAARAEGRKGVEFLFADAVAALKKAVELDGDPPAPQVLLATAQYESGAFADAADTATTLLLHLQSLGGGAPDEVAKVHAVRANAASKSLVSDPQGGGAAQLLADARVSFRFLEAQGRLDADLRKAWADLEIAANAGTEAVAVWTRALQRTPDDQAALGAVVEVARAAGQPQLAVDALQQRSDATGLYFLGRARFLQAGDLRTGNKLDEAIAELDRARTCFQQSMALNQGFADSCQQWLACCLGKKGNVALAQQHWDDAEKWLLESVRLRPDQIATDLGLQESTKLGVIVLADHYQKAEDLAHAEAIYRAVTDKVQGDLDLLNNAGLFARDLGSQLEEQKKPKEAKVMYEQSYAVYGKACALDPANVQLRNDYALIAIHHLDRDWEQSKQLLEAAIADGERELAAFRGDAAAQQQLESAVGDCWENVALWHLKHDHDAKEAKAAAERSLQLYPGRQRSGARRHLQAAEQQLAAGKRPAEAGK